MNHALLVGINTYKSPDISSLEGCHNDIQAVQSYLELQGNQNNPFKIHRLLDAEATRKNILKGFREHLAQTPPGKLALFYYSGHGSREKAPQEMRPWLGGEEVNETIVCYDSRTDAVHDLADKEFAILIKELVEQQAEVVFILDCCHSGSATRESTGKPRLTSPQVQRVRPLDSFLEGQYSRNLALPTSEHLLLSACNKGQRAWENKVAGKVQGIFTHTLLELAHSGLPHLSYAILMELSHSSIQRYEPRQTPELSCIGQANPFAYFLNPLKTASHPVDFRIFFERNQWFINFGWVQGMTLQPDQRARFTISDSVDSQVALATVEISQVFVDKSLIEWSFSLTEGFAPDKSREFVAQALELPLNRITIGVPFTLIGSPDLQALQQQLLHKILFVPSSLHTSYVLNKESWTWTLYRKETEEELVSVQSSQTLMAALQHIRSWERVASLNVPGHILELQENVSESFAPDLSLSFKEIRPHTPTHSHTQSPIITLDQYPDEQYIEYQLITQNFYHRSLHYTVLHLSRKYGITVMYHDNILASGNELALVMDKGLFIPDAPGLYQVTDLFKILVSKEPHQGYLFNQVDLPQFLERPEQKKNHRESLHIPTKRYDWTSYTITVRTLRELGKIDENPLELLKGKIRIFGHPHFRSGVSLISTASHMPGPEWEYIHLRQFFELQGFELVDFSENGQKYTILDFHDIVQEKSLDQSSLEIQLDLPLSEDQHVFPFTFDGEAYRTFPVIRQAKDKVLVHLDNIPPNPADGRKASQVALKLCFLLTNQTQFDHLKAYGGQVLSRSFLSELSSI